MLVLFETPAGYSLFQVRIDRSDMIHLGRKRGGPRNLDVQWMSSTIGYFFCFELLGMLLLRMLDFYIRLHLSSV